MHIPEGEFYRPLSLKRFSIDLGFDFCRNDLVPERGLHFPAHTPSQLEVALLRVNALPVMHAVVCLALRSARLQKRRCANIFIDMNFF